MPIQSELRQQMFMMITQWQQSGLTQKAYCQEQSIKYHVFHYWYKCFREAQPGFVDNSPGFVKVQIAKPFAFGSAEIHFPSGVRLVFHEPLSSSYVKALIS